jgi:choice-of-anchor C domain-containing protein
MLFMKRGNIMRRGKAWIIISLLTVGLLWALPAQANLILNGDFELGTPVPSQGYLQVDAPNLGVTITNWDVVVNPNYATPNGVDVCSNALWQQPLGGTRSIDMSALHAGQMQQSFATTINTWYTVTFDMAGNAGGGPAVKDLDVVIAGNTYNFQFNTTGKSYSNMGWVQKSFTFQANSTSSTLAFISKTDSNAGAAIDNVSVNPVPVPPGILLLGTGLLGLAVTRRKNRQR